MKKYASDLFDLNKMITNRLNVVYAPMGSGKTTLFKVILKKKKCLMIAPYKSCLDDFGLVKSYTKANTRLNHQFLYPGQLINTVTNSWPSNIDLTDEVVIEKATKDYVNNLPSSPITHILFDEVDFMWTQANLTHITNTKFHTRAVIIWEYILKALYRKFILIGQTSTLIPKSRILDIGGQLQVDAFTSVRFNSITPVLVDKNVHHDKLFKIAIDRSIAEVKQLPTLVYKSSFSGSDIKYMDKMVKQFGKRVLVVMRKEKSPMIGPSTHPEIAINHINAIEANNSSITSQSKYVHFKLININTALDKITPSPDPYKYFDYIFINTSSSRQVSLKKVRGNKTTKVRVITIGNKLTNTSHQAAGRFRDNRVDITHYLNGFGQKDIPSFSGQKLWGKLYQIDPCLKHYMKHDEVITVQIYLKYVGLGKFKSYFRFKMNTFFPHIDKQQKIQATWIPKPKVNKPTSTKAHRIGVLDSWLKTASKLKQKQTYKSYEAYCNSIKEASYNKNDFGKLKRAIMKKQP